MRIKKIDISILFFSLYLIFISNCFGLLDSNLIPTADIGLLFGIVFFAYNSSSIKKNDAVILVLFGIVLSFVSAWTANIITGQSLALGLRAQRLFILSLLMFFPLTSLSNNGYFWTRIVKVIKVCGVIQVILNLLQYLFYNRLVFLHFTFSERYGSVRIYGTTILVIMAYYFFVDEQSKSKIIIKKNVFGILLILFNTAFISKGRVELIVFVFIAAICYLKWRGSLNKKLFVAILAISVFAIIFNNDVIELILQAFQGKSTLDSSTLVRVLSREWYVEALRKSPIFGNGFVNMLHSPAATLAGFDRGYLFVDNGIYGFLYQYGLIGGIWNILFLLKLFKYGRELFRKNRCYIVFLYTVVTVMNFMSGEWMFYPSISIVPVIFLSVSMYLEKNNEHSLYGVIK